MLYFLSILNSGNPPLILTNFASPTVILSIVSLIASTVIFPLCATNLLLFPYFKNTTCPTCAPSKLPKYPTYISNLPSPIIINKLSFIGHSLGGIIIRTALCYLSEYRKLMHLYISLGSPHLGCAQFSNKLVEAGLWILSKLRNSTCIQQLTFKDSLSPRSCFLYELAMKSRLNYFAQVVLVSSSQDAYVPYESARIEIGIGCQDMIQLEMADTVVGKIQQLHRVNVDFPIKAGLINNMHGRAAHISLLDNQSFLNALVYRFADSFSER